MEGYEQKVACVVCVQPKMITTNHPKFLELQNLEDNGDPIGLAIISFRSCRVAWYLEVLSV